MRGGPAGARSCATPSSSRSRRGSQDGISCFTVGEPGAPPAGNLRRARAPRESRRWSRSGLFVQGELLGALVLASAEPALIDTDDVELLEQLATHGGGVPAHRELIGSLRERAESDPLTGLGHHATFHEALAGSHRRPTTAVVVCDIDGFKLLNDTYGHGHGDRVLCGVADAHEQRAAPRRPALPRRRRRVRRPARRRVARAGARRRRRLREAVVEARLGVTVSIGVAVPQADETDAALLARADRALYSVKAAGRDGVALANDEPLTAPPALG